MTLKEEMTILFILVSLALFFTFIFTNSFLINIIQMFGGVFRFKYIYLYNIGIYSYMRG